MDTSTIVILDFGSQYTQLIARRIREFNVFSVVLPCTVPLDRIKALSPLGIILSGGPSSVYDKEAPAADPAILALGVPILFALALWMVLRGAWGVWTLKSGRAIADPRGWWI